MNNQLNDQNMSNDAKNAIEQAMSSIKSELDEEKNLLDLDMVTESQQNADDLLTAVNVINKEVEKEAEKINIQTNIALGEE